MKITWVDVELFLVPGCFKELSALISLIFCGYSIKFRKIGEEPEFARLHLVRLIPEKKSLTERLNSVVYFSPFVFYIANAKMYDNKVEKVILFRKVSPYINTLAL